MITFSVFLVFFSLLFQTLFWLFITFLLIILILSVIYFGFIFDLESYETKILISKCLEKFSLDSMIIESNPLKIQIKKSRNIFLIQVFVGGEWSNVFENKWTLKGSSRDYIFNSIKNFQKQNKIENFEI